MAQFLKLAIGRLWSECYNSGDGSLSFTYKPNIKQSLNRVL